MPSDPKPPPRWLTRLNVALLRLGMPIGSQHLLSVPGRKTGKLRSTPVSLLTLGGRRYIVAGLGEVDWVKNARAAGWVFLTRGRRQERARLIELPAEERVPVLREFPRQVPGGTRFFGLPPDPEAFAAAAPRCPVFRVEPVPADAAPAR
jgi:deazaflavin-dependent oxidoreductase (nitroreductase family)